MYKEEKPSVSVIVPTYNHRPYIRQALDGILQQRTSFKFEILIGDDASNDGTGIIIREYQKRYPDKIRAFFRSKNLGASRNGYELGTCALGRYLAGCEGDDFWTDPKKLQIQFDFLEAHSEFSACTHEMTIVNKKGIPESIQKLSWISRRRFYTIYDLKGFFLPGQNSTLMRRNFFLEPDFDGTIIYKANRMISDRTIAMIWAMQGNIYRINRNMSCYRQVLEITGTNATAILYINNTDRIQDDFNYTLTLERYAVSSFKKKIDFDYHKRRLLVSAFIYWIAAKFYNTQANFHLVTEIFDSIKRPFYTIAIIPIIILEKICNKIWTNIRRKK